VRVAEQGTEQGGQDGRAAVHDGTCRHGSGKHKEIVATSTA